MHSVKPPPPLSVDIDLSAKESAKRLETCSVGLVVACLGCAQLRGHACLILPPLPARRPRARATPRHPQATQKDRGQIPVDGWRRTCLSV